MGKKHRILVTALALAALGSLAWVLFPHPEPEPVYQDKRLSVWLRNYTDSRSSTNGELAQQADDAVRHIGSNAIPTLLRMLRSRDSFVGFALLSVPAKRHWVSFHYTSAGEVNLRALMAFRALGAAGKAAVPDLIETFNEKRSLMSQASTVRALGSIGPGAAQAEPLLLQVAADTDRSSQRVLALSWAAIEALGRIGAQPDEVVPVLRRLLHEPNPNTRYFAAQALGNLGANAKAAIPELVDALNDKAFDVRRAVADAIGNIDPATAELRNAELHAATAPEHQYPDSLKP